MKLKTKFGSYEGYPARFADTEAWVSFDDKNWTEVNAAEVTFNAAVLSKASFDHEYGSLPELPTAAFVQPAATRREDGTF